MLVCSASGQLAITRQGCHLGLLHWPAIAQASNVVHLTALLALTESLCRRWHLSLLVQQKHLGR